MDCQLVEVIREVVGGVVFILILVGTYKILKDN